MRHMNHELLAAILTGLLLVTINRYTHAADFYVDPENGTVDGDGSASAPWQSLQQVLDDGLVTSQEWDALPPEGGAILLPKNAGAPVGAGDTIWLRSGDYGAVSVTGYYNTAMITVAAAENADARLTRLLVRGSANWTFRGLQISPAHGDDYEPVTMVDIDSHDWQGPVRDIVIDGCHLQSVADVSGWSLDDWNSLPANGINADGTNIAIENNTIRNVNFGISVNASESQVVGNTVSNFAGDGLRGLGDYTVFAYNVVKNCYDVNDNHDDGFQSWSVGDDGVGTGVVKGIVLRGNTIINYEDPNQPFRGTLQGIGCFDGMFEDWVVENNVIYTDHWHGISLYGALNCRIVNNTVLDPNNEDPGPPWIMINDHKDGTPPENCLIANNLATAYSGIDDPAAYGNMTIDDPSTLFTDIAGFDFRLQSDCAAVDAGLNEYAPERDGDQVARPQGDAVDVGAYEWHEATVEPDPDTDLVLADTDTSDDSDNTNTANDSGNAGDGNGDQDGCGCSQVGRHYGRTLLTLLALFLVNI